MAVVGTPCDPSGRPDITRDPKPAIIGIIDPAPVMKGDIAPGIGRLPRPAIFGIDPIAPVIGPEIAFDADGLPDVAPARVLVPAAIGRQPIIEIAEADP